MLDSLHLSLAEEAISRTGGGSGANSASGAPRQGII